ncbi:MAG: hypothetical protein Q7U99_14455 [Rubrivivax sp.]|nr:hypothetical protein [Rubrivivax sp.]
MSVGIGVELPGISIGIDQPAFPDLQRVPGYPVYHAPQAQGSYFFYDGLYWVYQRDEWYSSGLYNGPWRAVGRYDVPAYLLRVPVRYYRQPPPYFRAWQADAPPRRQPPPSRAHDNRRDGERDDSRGGGRDNNRDHNRDRNPRDDDRRKRD